MQFHYEFSFLFCTLLQLTQSANILYFSGGSQSHKFAILPVAQEMARRGHNVTFVSPFPPKETTQNITEIMPRDFVQFTKLDGELDIFSMKTDGSLDTYMWSLMDMLPTACESILSSPETKDLFKNDTKFDLIVIDALFCDCALGLVHYHKVPFIYFSTTSLYSWLIYPTAQPNISPWSLDIFGIYGGVDTMLGRVTNALLPLYWHYKRVSVGFSGIQELYKQYYNIEIPSLEDIDSDVSLIFTNSHPAVDLSHPLLPDVVPIGGIHLKKSKGLPEDLELFMKESDHGVIIFSFGSVVRSSDIPLSTVSNLLKVFSQLPQRILWKYEADSIKEELPKNVMIRKWIPQNDLLAHPNTVAFISHGGRLGTFESLNGGVPIVMVPFYGDQAGSASQAEELGYGIKLEAKELEDYDKVKKTLLEITTNPRYKEAAEARSHILRDELSSPLQRAIYWTEYVLRHNGATHLRSHARKLPLYKFYHLDAVALLLITATVLLAILKRVFLAVILKLCNTTKIKSE